MATHSVKQILTADGDPVYADVAIRDKDGNEITETYATKDELESVSSGGTKLYLHQIRISTTSGLTATEYYQLRIYTTDNTSITSWSTLTSALSYTIISGYIAYVNTNMITNIYYPFVNVYGGATMIGEPHTFLYLSSTGISSYSIDEDEYSYIRDSITEL